MRREMSKKAHIVFSLLSVLTMIGVYSLVAYGSSSHVLPTWGQMWEGLQKIIWDPFFEESYLWDDSIASFSRLFPAIGIASVIGVVIGMYMGVYASAQSYFGIFLLLIGNIPANSIMVAIMIYLGNGFLMYVGIIVFGTMAIIAKGTFLGVKAISDEHVFSLKTLDASSTEIVWTVLFGEVLPNIIEAILQAIGLGLIYLIATEWVVGSEGFGYRFMMFQRSARMELIFPYVIYLGLVGIAIGLLGGLIKRLICRGHVKEAS